MGEKGERGRVMHCSRREELKQDEWREEGIEDGMDFCLLPGYFLLGTLRF